MKTKGLEKLYDSLTARERLPLMVAAAGRGDEAEAERLSRSAPTLTFRVPDYHGLSEGLFALTALHLMTVLELVGRYWQASAVLAVAARLPKEEVQVREQQFLASVRLLAFELVTHAEAWGLFCGGLHLDAEWLLHDQPGYRLLVRTQASARAVAFSPEEALAYLRGQLEAARAEAGEAPSAKHKYHLQTAQEIAEDFQEVLERWVRSWS